MVRDHAVRAASQLPCMCVLSKDALSNSHYGASDDCVFLIKERLHNSQVDFSTRGPKRMFLASTLEELELKHYIISGKLLSRSSLQFDFASNSATPCFFLAGSVN